MNLYDWILSAILSKLFLKFLPSLLPNPLINKRPSCFEAWFVNNHTPSTRENVAVLVCSILKHKFE
jgi:hypothetical protein